jgi:acyl-CoA synthetase (AMP-forming)/AMP-acid ligase II
MAAERVPKAIRTAWALARTGMLRPQRPDKLVRALGALRRWGPTPAAGYTASAIRYPDELAIIDDLGMVTFSELHRRTNSLARGLAGAGIGPGDGIAIMCRNHRYFIDATVAASKLGANALYLNTAFAGPQITAVLTREQPAALIYDNEFHELVAQGGAGCKRFIGWHEDGAEPADPLLEDLMRANEPADLSPPSERGRVVILTSGTTGTPRGASRRQPESLAPAAALFDKIPLRARQNTMIAAPMFHSWGFAHFTLGLALSSTLVLRRRFDAAGTLAAMAENRCAALVVVPVMLKRLVELGPERIGRYDLSSLRVIAASGSVLPGELARTVMDRFGEVLYNLYGSTEVAWATIATPADLRAAPGTAGRPPLGTVVKLLDEQGHEVAAGETGRIFVSNEMLFEGYTGGGGKDVVEGVMSTGDVGHLDGAGRLFVDGRDDEMIISGGENVFPREVEDLLANLEGVDEVAVIGVLDEEFGERLKAFVVVTADTELTEADVKAHVSSNLARYKVPRDVVFLAELPRNATGKIVKRELS